MTSLTSKEEAVSTIVETKQVDYTKATTPDASSATASTAGISPVVRSVSTSITTGEVKLRLAPREIPNRTLNNNSR